MQAGDVSGDGLTFAPGSTGAKIDSLTIRKFQGDGINLQSGTTAGSTRVTDCTITDNTLDGIRIASLGNWITGSFIARNEKYGINVAPTAKNTTIGAKQNGNDALGDGNTIVANSKSGIYVNTASGARIQGNMIGIMYFPYTFENEGEVAANGADGVTVNAADDTQIGGAVAGLGNVISGNAKNGISLTGAVTDQKILRNIIGLNLFGDAELAGNGPTGNGEHGVLLDGTGVNGANGITIGSPSAGNVIASNYESGVRATGGQNVNVWDNIIGAFGVPAGKAGGAAVNGQDAISAVSMLKLSVRDNKGFYKAGTIGINVDKTANPSVEKQNALRRAGNPGAGGAGAAVRIQDCTDVFVGDGNIFDASVEILSSSRVEVLDNLIGLDIDGTPFSTAGLGVFVDSASDTVTVDGNAIFSNGELGIQSAGTNVVIRSNALDQELGVDVEIDAGSALFTQPGMASLFLLDGESTFEGLSGADEAFLEGGTMLITQTGWLDTGDYTQSGGEATVSGSLTASGTLWLQSGPLLITASGLVDTADYTQTDGAVSVYGSLTASGDGLKSAGTLTVHEHDFMAPASTGFASFGGLTHSGGTTTVLGTLATTNALHLSGGSISASGLVSPELDLGSYLQTGGSLTTDNTLIDVVHDFQIDHGTSLLQFGTGTVGGQVILNGGCLTLSFVMPFTVMNGAHINEAGRLELVGGTLDGDVFNDGVLSLSSMAAGSGVELDIISGNFTQTSGGTLIVVYGPNTLSIGGTATLAGTLIVQSDGAALTEGCSDDVLTYAGHVGEFDDVGLPPLDAALSWDVDYGSGALVISVVAA